MPNCIYTSSTSTIFYLYRMGNRVKIEDRYKVGKLKRPLNRKAFVITLYMTLGVGLMVMVAGYSLYINGVTHEFAIEKWNQANAGAALIEQTDYREICDEVLSIYDSMPAEAKAHPSDPEYLAKFSHIKGNEFNDILDAMHGFQDRNGPMNSFIVALDPRDGRMIFVVDADDDKKTNYPPGRWELYPTEEIEVLIDGAENTAFEKRQGIEQGVQAVFTNQPGYGERCTAGSTLYQNGNYTVMFCVDETLEPLLNNSRVFLTQYVALLLVITLIASVIGMLLIRNAMVVPINKMAKAAVAYGQAQGQSRRARIFEKLDIHTEDEIEALAIALKGMEADIADYVTDLTRVTAERERLNTELSLAARIQKGMLTTAFPQSDKYEVFATMEPAKEIGGDFYDVIVIDDDHVAFEIADVSGKGIPAALFMMASKINIADDVMVNMDPADVLEKINQRALRCRSWRRGSK